MAENLQHRLRAWSREELKYIWEYLDEPGTREDYHKKWAIRLFLSGQDAFEILKEEGLKVHEAYAAACNARDWLEGERTARRRIIHEISKEREAHFKKIIKPRFTFENFGFNIDKTKHKDVGMTAISIYSVVEVWDEDEETEKEYLINFSDFRTKEWLTRLMVWGLMNKKQILVQPATEQAMSTMRMFVPKDREVT